MLSQRRWRGCLIEPTELTQTPAAYRLATDALTLAPHRAFADRSLLLEGDAQVLALLAARPTADPARVTEAVLGPVTGPGSEHLIEGLDAYCKPAQPPKARLRSTYTHRPCATGCDVWSP